MPAPTPTQTNPLSGRYVAISYGAIAAGAFFTDDNCVAIAVLADGSTTPSPEGGKFQTQEGELGVSATLNHVYRLSRFIKGDAEAIKPLRNAGGVVCSVINRGATSYTDFGPGVISHVTPMGNNVEDEPGGARVEFSATEDFAEDIISVQSAAAVIAAA